MNSSCSGSSEETVIESSEESSNSTANCTEDNDVSSRGVDYVAAKGSGAND